MKETVLASILIVDDDKQVREILKTFLEREGYYVTVTKGGREAIRSAIVNEFDLIITDLIMPGGGGLEEVSYLQEAEFNIKVIIISGFLTENIIKKLRSFDTVFEILEKPVKLDALSSVVKQALK